MKKSIIITAILIISLQTMGQKKDYIQDNLYFSAPDTFAFYERIPGYYYDTTWCDKYIYNPVHENAEWQPYDIGTLYRKPEIARYCHTDSSLRVIGVAGSFFLFRYRWDWDSLDIWKNTEPNYLRLYEIDTSTDDLVLLASKPWDHTNPRHLCQAAYYPNHPNPVLCDRDYYPFFEVYFDSAITVRDSFYVSATLYNNRDSQDEAVYALIGGMYECSRYFYGDYVRPQPPHFRCKLLVQADENNRDYGWTYYVTDTNWHTFARWSRGGSINPAFFMLFPIIDTSHYSTDSLCHEPYDLGVMSTMPGAVMLSWNGGGSSRWELSVAPEGGIPETGARSEWDNTVATVTGLEAGGWHYAWVRSLCDSATASGWSERIRFYVPEDSTQSQGVASTVDRHTHVMPNPATEMVSVVSSFRISSVEAWSLNGSLALRQETDAMSTTLDVSSLPRGTYILRITTVRGMAYKKLVVE